MSGPREALLGRIVEYYAQHGIRDTSLRTLAAGIGTSQRMLHYHFGSREDVLTAVIEAVTGQQAEHIAALLAVADDPFVAGRRNWEATVDGAQRYGALWFELATHAMRGEPYAKHLGEVMVTAQLRAFTHVYARHTHPSRAERLARLTLAAGQGLTFSLLIDHDRPAADAAIGELTALIRESLNHQAVRHQPVEECGDSSPSRPGRTSSGWGDCSGHW